MGPPRILDPRAAPVAGTDAHLPAIDPQNLTAQALRRRFADPPPWQPEHPGDGRVFVERAPAAAAVLVPLVERADGLHVLLTRRNEQLRDHAGQISFPGGKSQPGDEGAVGTALRETQEEVGLAAQHVDVIGQMPVYNTVTSFIVTPVVALVQPPFDLALDESEVSEAFEVPLAFLMNPAHHQRHVFMFDGGQRQFLSMPWPGHDAQGRPREYFIWGATAAMLRNLYSFLSGG
jgi:8-oxo-dGTP pyrophosphatase MutT (NUDIX family)